MIDIKAESLDALAKSIRKLPQDYNFAGVVALTQTAKAIQADIKDKQLPDAFDLKNQWTQKGIRITPATKEKPEAEVYTKDWYLPDHDDGGRRSPDNVANSEFWIPGKAFKLATGIDPEKQVIPKAFRRPAIMNQPFPTVAKTSRGKGVAKPFRVRTRSGTEVIAHRTEPKPARFNVLWVIVKKAVNIKGRKFFEEPAQETFQKVFNQRFDEAFKRYVLKV